MPPNMARPGLAPRSVLSLGAALCGQLHRSTCLCRADLLTISIKACGLPFDLLPKPVSGGNVPPLPSNPASEPSRR